MQLHCKSNKRNLISRNGSVTGLQQGLLCDKTTKNLRGKRVAFLYCSNKKLMSVMA